MIPVDVVLVYPYFNEERDRSIFRYPPLGLGYLASVLRNADIRVKLIDCTFSEPTRAIRGIRSLHPRVVGIYSMVTMNHHAIDIAGTLRDEIELLVAGGPLPSLVPDSFLDLFDVVVLSEGEVTFLELVRRHLDGRPWQGLQGTAHRNDSGEVIVNQRRELIEDLDRVPFPARDMFPNDSYKRYWRRYHGYTATSEMSSRGCPYACDFCSSPVFGRSYRERSPQNVCDEMTDIHSLGYDRVFFTDDCFTLNPARVEQICAILSRRNIDLDWMCLSRVDTLTRSLAKKMADAGCVRVFFGIEAGNDRMLRVMNKRTDLSRVRGAIEAARQAGIETGGFFILGYPGETDSSLLETLRFSSSLKLDYLSYSFPYPIVGTGLYNKVEKRITRPEWRKQRGKAGRHQLLFAADYSSSKLTFARYKGEIQHLLRQRGAIGSATASVFEKLTDRVIPGLR